MHVHWTWFFVFSNRGPQGLTHPRQGSPAAQTRDRAAASTRRGSKNLIGLAPQPGFGIWLANFREIFVDGAANAELSEYIADRIRRRVKDPKVAEKLIPRDHGFGVQRRGH